MSSNKEVLFVSHEANRTGAPLVLLRLLEWVKANTNLGFQVLLLRTGPLKPEFEALSKVVTLERQKEPLLLVAERELLRRGHTGPSRVLSQIIRARLRRQTDFGLIYLNSVVSIPVLRHIPGRIGRVIAHVHELSTAMKLSIPPPPLFPAGKPSLMSRVDRYIAAANCVKEDLVKNYAIAPDRVTVHHEFVDVGAIDSTSSVESTSNLRRQLGIPENSQIVIGCGSLEWRKGPDLFIQLARLLTSRNTNQPIHFVWVGGEKGDRDYPFFVHDLEHSRVAEHVHLVPSTEHRFDYFRLADVFVLTSREDPFPLVCLEASLLGLPVVSFENGGMSEFLAEGSLVPYLDVSEMADRVLSLIADDRARKVLADEAAARVRRDHDVSVRAPAIFEEIDRLLKPAASADQPPNLRLNPRL